MSARRDAIERDLVGITSEHMDVLVDPLDCSNLISETEVLEVCLLRQSRRKEAERADLERGGEEISIRSCIEGDRMISYSIVEGDGDEVLRRLGDHARKIDLLPRSANEEACRVVEPS
jgi:hypothetical protein